MWELIFCFFFFKEESKVIQLLAQGHFSRVGERVRPVGLQRQLLVFFKSGCCVRHIHKHIQRLTGEREPDTDRDGFKSEWETSPALSQAPPLCRDRRGQWRRLASLPVF